MPKENYLKIETTEATYFEDLVGTANRMSDAKGQFIQVDRRLFEKDQLSSGCTVGNKIAVANISGKFPIDEIRKTVKAVINETSFSFGNKPDQIIEAFKVQHAMYDASAAVVSNPKALVFPVNGDISPLDVICASPAIKAVRAKAMARK